MINLIHTYHPQSILFSFGPINIYWYGLFMVIAILAALGICLSLARYYQVKPETLFDLAFWLIINGLIGARVYDVLLEFSYYLKNPIDIFKIWQGGLAIHGAIFAGLITIYFFAKKNKLNFWKLCALIVPGLALGQALGRFGNYFNQEIFGLPTNLPWGIPIDLINRPIAYANATFFHPTFLYESFGSLLIFLTLLLLNIYFINKRKLTSSIFILISSVYLLLYSLLRFALEFIRIDWAPNFLGLRWPQFISLIIIFLVISLVSIKQNDKIIS